MERYAHRLCTIIAKKWTVIRALSLPHTTKSLSPLLPPPDKHTHTIMTQKKKKINHYLKALTGSCRTIVNVSLSILTVKST